MPHRSTIRVIREITVGLPPAEVGSDPDVYTCLICGKVYKTESRYENHLETHDE